MHAIRRGDPDGICLSLGTNRLVGDSRSKPDIGVRLKNPDHGVTRLHQREIFCDIVSMLLQFHRRPDGRFAYSLSKAVGRHESLQTPLRDGPS